MNPKLTRILSMLLVLVLSITLAGPTTVSAAGITGNRVEIEVGESTTLKVPGWYSQTTWTSSDESVATVSTDGTVTGVAAGTATITATSKTTFGFFGGSAKTTAFTIVVTEPAAETALDLKVGETLALSVDAGGKVTWKSSDTSVATVDGNGVVTGISEGSATITATIRKANNRWLFWWGSGKASVVTFEITVLPSDQEPSEPEEDTTVFDESSIVLSFGAISDTHINTSSTVSEERLANALNILSRRAAETDADGLDAVCVVGDLIDNACNSSQGAAFLSTLEENLDTGNVQFIYTLGNHDISWGGDNELSQIAWFAELFGESYFENNLTDAEAAARGDYHFAVNGYHFVCITPMSNQPITYAEESKQWLADTLAQITAENPDQFVYVLTHPMIADTVYGSELNDSDVLPGFWATDDLTEILSQYSQVVTFGGHLHFPVADERSIMQDTFTSLGTGSVRYMAIENGGYEDMKSATVMNDNQLVSSGYLVQVDANGNMRVTRLDFLNDSEIKTAWEIQAPASDNSHLETYTQARGDAENNAAPEMNGSAEVTMDNSFGGSKVAVELTFDAGTDDDVIHHYVITYGEEGSEETTTKKILADYYLLNETYEPRTVYTLDMGALTRGKTYLVTIYAEDCWGAQSNPVELTVEIPGTSEEVVAEELADAYVDLVAADGTLTDTKDHVPLTSNGASVQVEEVTLGEATANRWVLNVDAQKECYTAVFQEQETAEDNKEFVESGFTVEAFYINRNPSGTQGVICGTQAGGWGLAESNGEPYFIAKFGTQYYSVYAGETASNTELTHVVASYDPEASELVIYVNGEKMARTKVSGEFVPGDGSAFNGFCIGADIGANAAPDSYYMTDFSLVSGKIYDYTLTSGQVVTAYQNALALLEESVDVEDLPTESEDPEEEPTVTPEELADAYAELTVSGDFLVDSKGKLSLTNNGASIVSEDVTLGDVTVSRDVLKVSAEKQCYVATFTEQETSDDNKAFVEAGFSVEAFYINRTPSTGIQGVICGTQAGGWGLAENAGEPYFIAKFGSQYYSVYAGETATNTELTHVIAVYDPEASELVIYLNGEKKASTSVSGEFVPGSSNAFNSFCIGADIDGDGVTPQTYFMTDFSLVSGKIYDYALTEGQVVTAYQKAVESLS